MAPFTYDLTVSHCLKQRTESPGEMRELFKLLNCGASTSEEKKKKPGGGGRIHIYFQVLKYRAHIHGYLNRTTTVPSLSAPSVTCVVHLKIHVC